MYPSHDIKIIIGDLKAKVSQEEEFRSMVKGISARQLTNDTRLRFIDFATSQSDVKTAYAQHLGTTLPDEGELHEASLEHCWSTVETAINNAENFVGM